MRIGWGTYLDKENQLGESLCREIPGFDDRDMICLEHVGHFFQTKF